MFVFVDYFIKIWIDEQETESWVRLILQGTILGRPLLRPAKVSITSKECDTSNEVNNAIIMMEFNVHSTTNNEITIVMVYLWRQFLDK